MQQWRVAWTEAWPLGLTIGVDIGDYPGVYLLCHDIPSTVVLYAGQTKVDPIIKTARGLN